MVEEPKPRVRIRRRVPPPAPATQEPPKPVDRTPRAVRGRSAQELLGTAYCPFANGGAPMDTYIRVGVPSKREHVGFVCPGVDSRRAAYVQNKDGTRTFVGWHSNYKAAHKAVVAAAASRPRTRARAKA